MRVVVVASYASSLIAFRGDLVNELLKRGATVHIVVPDASIIRLDSLNAVPEQVVLHDLHLHRTGTNPLHDFRIFMQLCRLMKSIKPDVVLPYTIKPVVYGLMAAMLCRVPKRYALITGLGYAFTAGSRSFSARIARALYRLSLSFSHKVFFQNKDDEALFRSERLLTRKVPSVIVNGSGVDTQKFFPEPMPDVPIFLMIARLLGDKGVREFVASARQVKRAYPHAEFHLVGWVDENPDAICQSELDAWVSEGVVKYLGKLEDVRPAIARCSVYVLPSYREGTPRTVLEAMAMGRAVITTDAPGCRETVIPGVNGFLVPVKDVDRLAEAMLKFMESPVLAREMGARSREIAEQKYDVRKVNEVMLREMGI